MRALLCAAAAMALAVTSAFAEQEPGLAISKDGTSVAVTVDTKRVMLLDGRTGEIRWRIGRRKLSALTGSTFSPDGSLLYMIGDDWRLSGYKNTVIAVSSATGEIVDSFSGRAIGRRQLVFSSDGSLLITDGGPRKLQVWSVPERRLILQITTSPSSVENVDFTVTHDNRYVFVATSDQRVRKFDISSGVLVASTSPLFKIRSIVSHNQRRSLVVTGADIAEIDPATMKVTKSLGRTARAAASASGLMATCNLTTDVKIRNRKLQPVRSITFPGDCDELAMSRDARRLAVRLTTGAIKMYDVETGALLW